MIMKKAQQTRKSTEIERSYEIVRLVQPGQLQDQKLHVPLEGFCFFSVSLVCTVMEQMAIISVRVTLVK